MLKIEIIVKQVSQGETKVKKYVQDASPTFHKRNF